MVVVVPLNKVFKQGVNYRTHPRTAYLIEKIGTDGASATRLKVDGKDLGALISDVAPLRKTNSYIVGPLDISRLPYVIPPETDFSVDGPSGAKVRVIGKVYLLAPGEPTPESLLARFREQPNKHIRYVEGSVSLGTDVAWADGDEITLTTITPLTIEKFKFNDLVMVKIENATINDGDVVIQFYLDNNPLENLYGTNISPGIDVLAMPHRDDVGTNEIAFTLKDFPIEVIGDHTLKVTAKNVSGSAISPPSGASITLTLYMVAEYEKGGR